MRHIVKQLVQYAAYRRAAGQRATTQHHVPVHGIRGNHHVGVEVHLNHGDIGLHVAAFVQHLRVGNEGRVALPRPVFALLRVASRDAGRAQPLEELSSVAVPTLDNEFGHEAHIKHCDTVATQHVLVPPLCKPLVAAEAVRMLPNGGSVQNHLL